ncbi:hypothetical protein IEQ34_022269 [Dendrobium chrysotoxum]|uniref:DUF1995 domain-containing protein n=1 Tax=Dendrobium chrysotoxum TaxID=161865 RepID=A0AAV7FK32_DENCH|nr:hypothetical protein IEQ34_022269 [Dendrobium chrysotoxum]
MFAAPSTSLSCSYHYPRLLQIYPSPSSLALIGFGRCPSHTAVTARAKFEKFDADNAQPPTPVATTDEAAAELRQELDEDRQSGQASAAFITSGGMRAMVELLIPQLQFLDAEGAQGELWELSRIFLETLIEETGIQKVRAIFPDAGAAALLKYQWGDANFGFASLSDRRPVEKDDEVVVMLVPDYQMLEYVERIASQLSDDPVCESIEITGWAFNEQLLTVKLHAALLLLWKVFYDDVNRPNRYLLAKEQPSRPDATDIEQIFGTVSQKSEEAPSLFGKAMGMFTSLNRFMRAISRYGYMMQLHLLEVTLIKTSRGCDLKGLVR